MSEKLPTSNSTTEQPAQLKTALELALERGDQTMAQAAREEAEQQRVIDEAHEEALEYGGMNPESNPTSNGDNKNRSRGQASRKQHNQKRAKTDPKARKGNIAKPADPNKNELSWAEEYARENIDLFEGGSEQAKTLIGARTKLAEAATAAREGSLVSNRKKIDALKQVQEQYDSAKKEFMAHQLEDVESATPDQRRAFVALLDSKERGALMGEEAYEYLATTEHASAFDKLVAKYNDLPRAGKIVIGVGAAAVTAVTAGLAAGGAAAGVAVSGRFGRGYFSEEAKRRKGDEQTPEERQRAATVRKGNEEHYTNTHDELQNTRASQPFERVDSALLERAKKTDEEFNNQTDAQIEAERLKESTMKRKAIGKAALFGAVGYGVGRAASEALHFFSDAEITNGADEAHDDAPGSVDEELQNRIGSLTGDIEAETETSQDLTDQYEQELERQEGLLQELEDTSPEEPEEPGVVEDGEIEGESLDEISERSQYLYGELAGEEVSVTIPDDGNIWNQLEAVVDNQMSSVDGDEKQRIVANILNAMQEEYPGRDLNLVYPGEEFNIDIPS